MSQSPPLEATGEHRAMGASAPGQGIKGEMALDADQRKQYFGGDTSKDTRQQASIGSDVQNASTAATDSAQRAADQYKHDKEERF